MYFVYWKQGQELMTHGVNSFDRFYVARLPCPIVMLCGEHEFKLFQPFWYFSSDSAASGAIVRSSDSSSNHYFINYSVQMLQRD